MELDVRSWIAIIVNLVNFLTCALVIWMDYDKVNEETGKKIGKSLFRYFTTDSNILAALSSLILVIVMLTTGGEAHWAHVLRFWGTASVTLTFLVVMFFLGPTAGYKMMLSGGAFFMHLVNPLLSIVSFLFVERGTINTTEMILTVCFSFVYALVYLYMVIIRKKENGGWEDFYGFNMGGLWYISFIAINTVMFFIGFGLSKLAEIL